MVVLGQGDGDDGRGAAGDMATAGVKAGKMATAGTAKAR